MPPRAPRFNPAGARLKRGISQPNLICGFVRRRRRRLKPKAAPAPSRGRGPGTPRVTCLQVPLPQPARREVFEVDADGFPLFRTDPQPKRHPIDVATALRLEQAILMEEDRQRAGLSAC